MYFSGPKDIGAEQRPCLQLSHSQCNNKVIFPLNRLRLLTFKDSTKLLMKRTLLTLMLATGVAATTVGQTTRPSAPAAQDSTRRSASSSKQPKPYKQVITDKAVTKHGLFTVHQVDDRYFFELANNVLNREILVVSRISKAGSAVRDASGYAGDQIGSSVIKFEKGPSNRIFLRKVSYSTYSPDSTKSMHQAVSRSNVAAIAGAFNISAYSDDKSSSVIDVTDYINSDNEIFFFSSPTSKQRFSLGNQINDRSFINNIRSFPTNVEIGTTKTYSRAASRTGTSGPSAPASGSITIEVNTSMIALPEKPMQPRYFDPRVGYFAVGYTDFDANPHGIKELGLIKRWRLEPKPEDVAKYKRGELVEPAKPIVFYIDPATPKKWVPYLIKGVNDWQKAFEKAGFKNAIIGKEAPTWKQDSTWSLDDARNSAIVYKPSEIPNASGPSISDPRTGEIMESHINWYHNVMKLLRDWYFIQTAAVDKEARKMTFSDELMGQLIRFVSSHEVGHTLGLRHNYGSSSTVPVEKLRDKAWVEANGHTPSIMDYARFNYVAQPEDNISQKGLFPRIGDYDMWAIEWGYRWYPEAKNADKEVELLNKLTIERLANKRLWFGTETNPDDPRSQNEDLGDNAMLASTYGIKNLQRIMPNLPVWTKEPNESYTGLKEMYGQLTTQFNRYMGHVSKNIGGIYETPKTVEQAGTVYQRTPVKVQREAIAFLNKQLFTTPTWLLEPAVLNQTGENPAAVISKVQQPTINRLTSKTTLNKLIGGEALDGPQAYKVTDYFQDLNNAIFTELKGNQAIDMYRRNLQKMYVENLITLVKPKSAASGAETRSFRPATFAEPAESDVISVAKAELRNIDKLIKASSVSDSMTSYHLQDLADRISNALDPKG